MLLGAEFLAMLLVVVTSARFAVLFLFVVMMLDVDFVELKQGFLRYMPLGFVIALGPVRRNVSGRRAWLLPAQQHVIAPAAAGVTNAQALGRVLYTDYLVLFQLSGLVLFVAMIGAVVLTLRHRPNVRRQNVAKQVGRRRSEGVELKDVKTGVGVD